MATIIQHPRGWRGARTRARWKKLVNRTTIKNGLLACLALGMFGSLLVLGAFAYISRDLPDPNVLRDRQISQTTKIYDRTGEHLLYEIHGEQNRTLVKMQQGFCDATDPKLETDPNGIPLFVLQATIAAEDRGFCSHHGFSVTGLARAVLFGGSRGGGSTLTQQLVKNAILTNERSYERKAKELILSVELERRYSKDEILQIYFNEVPYGATYYGIQAASLNHFGKPVNELTLAEGATLAAIPQKPTTLINNPDMLRERRNWILTSMAEQGFITTEQAQEAIATDTPLLTNVVNITAPHFVFYVKEVLEETYGTRMMEEGGLKVITTLDYDKQLIAEEAVVTGVEENAERYGLSNASLVAIDPKTNQVIAMVGSKDYFDETIDGQVNVALRPRQPGSSIKPIVYAYGFSKGYTPNTVLWDTKTDFPIATGTYSPNNYDGGERGPVTVRYALQTSLNIPAVKMLYLVSVDGAIDFMESLGYSTFGDRTNFGLAIVLGGAEVELLDHTNAYAAFASEGVHRDPISILRVEDANGTVLQEWKESEGVRVMDENVARMLSNVLSDNASRADVFGISSNLQLGDRPVAAKTGTTNDYRDAWLVGYTPSLVAGVWAGNNDNTAMTRGGGSSAAGPIWNAFMRGALEGTPIESFTPPSIPVTGKPVIDGQHQSQTVTVDRASGKLATEYTPASYREEKTFAEYHDILHYVNRADPLGPVPEDPNADPYYAPWEAGVLAWITRKEEETGIKLEQGSAPTEYDDLHVPANFPTVTIETPSQNEEFTSRQMAINVNASAPRGVNRVEFYIDGFYLGSDTRAPFELSPIIPNTVERGYHTIKVVAYDDIDNAGSASVGVEIKSDGGATGFEILNPRNGETIDRIQESYTVVLSLDHPTDYAFVSVYADTLAGGSRTLVGTATAPTSPFITMAWTLPADGDWVLSAHAEGTGETDLDTVGVVVHLTSPDAQPPDPLPVEGEPETPLPLPDLNPFTPN